MYKVILKYFLLTCFLLPVIVSAQQINKNTTGKNGMVVSAREEATRIGLQVLMKGGNAFDAAIAVHFA